MTIDLVPLLVCLAGVLTYALASPQHPKAAELGRLAFFAGLLVVLLHVSTVIR